MAQTSKFQVGKTYATASICDHECIFSFVILGRTAKTVTVEVHDKVVRRRISTPDGIEHFVPFGSYSMCTVIGADDLTQDQKDEWSSKREQTWSEAHGWGKTAL